MSLPNSKQQLMAGSANPPQISDQSEQRPLMTRRRTWEFINSHGFPMTEAYFNKICLPSRNAGPPAAKLWGSGPRPRPLYDADQVLAWCEARSRSSQAA